MSYVDHINLSPNYRKPNFYSPDWTVKQETPRHKARFQTAALWRHCQIHRLDLHQLFPPFTNAIWRCSRKFQPRSGLVFADKTSKSGTEMPEETWETFGWLPGKRKLWTHVDEAESTQRVLYICGGAKRVCVQSDPLKSYILDTKTLWLQYCRGSPSNPWRKLPPQLYYQRLIHLSMMSSPKQFSPVNTQAASTWLTH